MELSTRESGTATIVDVVGDITLYNSPDMRKVLIDLLQDAAQASRDREHAQCEIY